MHRVPVFTGLAAGRLSRHEYKALLGRLLGFHRPMEQAVGTALAGNEWGLDGWERSDLLLSDLDAFGVSFAQAAALPRIAGPDRLSPAAAMGCLYVLEGSTLGGRHLARRLDGILTGADGRRFLAAAAEPGHVRWTKVCAALERCGADRQAAAEMLDSAADTFARFERWFADAG